MGEGVNFYMQYNIPEDILSRIPDPFWAAFCGEIVSVFGLDIFLDHDEEYPLLYISGTYGWNVALKATCKKMGLDWFYEYYSNLEWFESDQADSVLEDLLYEKFIKADYSSTQTGSYYLFLCQ